MSKRVLYIGGFELPDKNAAAQRVIANAKILQNICDEVVLAGVSKDSNQSSFLSNQYAYEGITCYDVKYPLGYKAWLHYITTIDYIKKLVEKHRITHIIAYNYPGFALYKLQGFYKNKNIKLLADCTEWYEATGGNPIRKFVKKLDVSLRMNTVQPKLDGLMVISDFLEEHYKAKGVKNIINIPPLVDLSMEKWSVTPLARGQEGIQLVYAGSPGGGQKDRLDTIINALHHLLVKENQKIEFSVIGITKEQYQNSFSVSDEMMQKVDKFVSFKGRLSHIECLQRIKSSDYQVFVRDENLTTKAGFPTKYVEAISCGTPVLTNSSSSIVNFYEEGKTGFLLDNSSLESLIKSFEKVFSRDVSDIESMKEYCKNAKIFNISKFESQFVQFLDKA